MSSGSSGLDFNLALHSASVEEHTTEAKIAKKELPTAVKIAQFVITVFALFVGLAVGTFVGGCLGSMIPFAGTLIGGSAGGAIAFGTVTQFLKFMDEELKEHFAK